VYGDGNGYFDFSSGYYCGQPSEQNSLSVALIDSRYSLHLSLYPIIFICHFIFVVCR
jgi:hypothetical protein